MLPGPCQLPASGLCQVQKPREATTAPLRSNQPSKGLHWALVVHHQGIMPPQPATLQDQRPGSCRSWMATFSMLLARLHYERRTELRRRKHWRLRGLP